MDTFILIISSIRILLLFIFSNCEDFVYFYIFIFARRSLDTISAQITEPISNWRGDFLVSCIVKRNLLYEMIITNVKRININVKW